jgi:hypothetical protein
MPLSWCVSSASNVNVCPSTAKVLNVVLLAVAGAAPVAEYLALHTFSKVQLDILRGTACA